MTNQLTAALLNPANQKLVLDKMPMVLSVLLIIACAHALARITWLMVPAEQQIDYSNTGTAPVNTGASGNRQQAFQQLTSAHLFGTASLNPKASPDKAKETQLNLVLRGVLATQPPEMASAIIARGKNGKEDIYGIGDKLPGGVLIKEIHAEHVLLERLGKLEILRLVKDEDVGLVSQADARMGATRSTAPATPREALTEIRSNILKNPTSFGEYAVPVVVKENGKQIGYRLQPQKKGDMLATIGIQPNDVITSVNGIELNDPSKSIGALRVLSNANEFNVMVKRNGVEVPLNIRLQ